MIRIICHEIDNSDVAGGVADRPQCSFKSFDIEFPELEKWMAVQQTGLWSYVRRQILGVEVQMNIQDGK